MRRTGRLIATVLIAVVVTAAGPLGSAAPAAATPRADSVVIVGIPGLRWDDVDAKRTPALTALARRGSVAALSVRSAPAVTCPAEGWLTLGAGTYAAVQDPGAAGSCADRAIPPVTQRGGGAVLPTFPLLRRLNEGLRFGADPGLLAAGTRCVSAVGPGAALAGADAAGRVTAYRPELPADPRPALARCPLAVVDLGTIPDGTGRTGAVARADAELARVAAARPAGSVLLVAGLAEAAARTPRLHVLIADGPGFDGGWAGSQSTRHTPYAQLADLGPTAVAVLGHPVPESAAGRPLSGAVTGRPASWPRTRAELIDADRSAVAQRAVVAPFWLLLAVASLLCYGTAALLVHRRYRTTPGGTPVDGRAPRRVALGCVALATVPGATFVAGLAPWWRAPGGTPGLVAALVTAVAVAAAVLTAAVVVAYRRSGPTAALGVLGGGAVLILVTDLLTGGRFQMDSMLGYNPLVAGRFYGIGNIAFAVLGVAALFVAVALAVGRGRWSALAITAVVAVVVTLIDGAPALGADFGGVLTLVPAFAVLALSVARAPVTPLRVALAGLAGVVVVGALGVADFLRPADDRSHLGRFVADVVDGQGIGVVRRKLLTNLDLLLAGPHTIAALVGSVVLAVVVLRPPRSLASAYAAIPALRPALVSVLVLGAVGAVTNDSSVAIPAVAGAVALPAVLAACLVAGRGRNANAADDTPRSESSEPIRLIG
jgi:hypothetical protein